MVVFLALFLETFFGSFVVVFLGIPFGYNGFLPPLAVPVTAWGLILASLPAIYVFVKNQQEPSPRRYSAVWL